MLPQTVEKSSKFWGYKDAQNVALAIKESN